jgi:ABC-type glycerol-3-phosphate transport system permease component
VLVVVIPAIFVFVNSFDFQNQIFDQNVIALPFAQQIGSLDVLSSFKDDDNEFVEFNSELKLDVVLKYFEKQKYLP